MVLVTCVAQWLEHCVSSAKGCGFDSQGSHILMKMYNLNAIVIKASAKCVNVNGNQILAQCFILTNMFLNIHVCQ